MTAYYLNKCGLTALVPYYRPGDPAVADAIKGSMSSESIHPCFWPNHGPVVRETLECAGLRDSRNWKRRANSICCGVAPALSDKPSQIADVTKLSCWRLRCS